jgi:hypothetical protein
MPAHSPSLRRCTARAGAAVRWAHPDADQARRELAAERIGVYIQRVLADAPPLNPEQRDRLAVLLAADRQSPGEAR